MIPGSESLGVFWVRVNVADVPLDVIVVRVEAATLRHGAIQGPTWNGFNAHMEEFSPSSHTDFSFCPRKSPCYLSNISSLPMSRAHHLLPKISSKVDSIVNGFKNELNWRGGETNFNRLIDWKPMNDRIWYLILGQVCPPNKYDGGTHICCSGKSFATIKYCHCQKYSNKFAIQQFAIAFGDSEEINGCLGQN